MLSKKIIIVFVAVFLLLLSFWLGRVTGKGNRESKSSSQEASSAGSKSDAESVPHTHEQGKADEHAEGKQEAQGLRLSPDERRNIGLKTVVADLRPIEK